MPVRSIDNLACSTRISIDHFFEPIIDGFDDSYLRGFLVIHTDTYIHITNQNPYHNQNQFSHAADPSGKGITTIPGIIDTAAILLKFNYFEAYER